MKKLVVIGITLIAIVALLVNFKIYLKREYLTLFKADGVIYSYNDSNRLDGCIFTFKKGVIQKTESYKNGKKEGWTNIYYSNGKVQSKRYYHLDTLDGLELKYYDNGKLIYQASIRNNKRYGGVYLYSNDGTLNSYSCFDINGKAFSTFDYNSSGDIIKISSPISLTTYSIDTRSNTTVLIGFVNKYIYTKDLFITVGTPPGTRLEINAYVNGVNYSGLKIVNNTIRINNAFPNKGINKIYLKVNMFYKKKEIIDGLNVDASILRE